MSGRLRSVAFLVPVLFAGQWNASLSVPVANVHTMEKIDVEAVGRMLDEALAAPSQVIRRSEFEETEPDYEYLDPAVKAFADTLAMSGEHWVGNLAELWGASPEAYGSPQPPP
ncbi:hypothetical protein SAMN05660473_01931 [Arthrobacter sp. 49Tsu3.1M3]|nr:hypothetical protein SAMN05660473_01931 [Arthrobacter sp. 49Tsu3.1M3]